MSTFGRNFDQISTPQCRSLVEVSTKLRHPKCRSLVEVWCRSLVDILSNILCSSLIYRATFDQTSTLGVSKFGRSLVEVWSKFGRSFDTGGVEVWSKFRPNFDPRVSKFGPIDDDRNNQHICYFFNPKIVHVSTHTYFIVQPKHMLFSTQTYFYFSTQK